jgi:hypothetical protein
MTPYLPPGGGEPGQSKEPLHHPLVHPDVRQPNEGHPHGNGPEGVAGQRVGVHAGTQPHEGKGTLLPSSGRTSKSSKDYVWACT